MKKVAGWIIGGLGCAISAILLLILLITRLLKTLVSSNQSRFTKRELIGREFTEIGFMILFSLLSIVYPPSRLLVQCFWIWLILSPISKQFENSHVPHHF